MGNAFRKDKLIEKTCELGLVMSEDIGWTNEKLIKKLGDYYIESHPNEISWGQKYVQSLDTIMLAKHMKDEAKNFKTLPIDSDSYVAEFKENGMRCVVTYSPEEGFQLITRTESVTTYLNGNITNKILFINKGVVTEPSDYINKFPYRFVLDAEILVDGDMTLDGVEYVRSNMEDYIQSIFSSLPEKAKNFQKGGHPISLHVFDVLYFQKDNLEDIPEYLYNYYEKDLSNSEIKFIEDYFKDYLSSANFNKKKAIPKKLYSYLWSLRGLPQYDIRRLPFYKRRRLRAMLTNMLSRQNLPFVEVDGEDMYKYAYLESVLSEGGEGCILKCLDAPYISTLRSSRSHRACLKVKQTVSHLMGNIKNNDLIDFDVFIIGANPPKSNRIKDMIGSLKCGIYLNTDDGNQVVHEIANISGLTHEWKRKLAMINESGEITLDPKYLGKVIAIDGMSLSCTSLRFHHAILKDNNNLVFKSKNPTDCVWDKSVLEDMIITRG